MASHYPRTTPTRGQHKPSRSLTSESTPLTLRHQRHRSLLHHQHSYSGHHHRREWPHDDKGPILADAAVRQGRHSFDMPRYELGSRHPILGQNAGGTSVGMGSAKRKGNDTSLLGRPGHDAMSRTSEENLRIEKEKAAARITGLGKSLADLNTFSNDTTRRLDETYYAVLEKTSALQSTISAMKELAILSRDIKDEFEKQSDEMVRDVQGQLDTLGGFEEQEKRIGGLQERIRTGRNKIHGLSERVDVVRRRVEGWEKADLEWRQRTRKRLRNVWIIMSVVFATLVLLLVGAKYAPPSEMADLDGQGAAPDGSDGPSPSFSLQRGSVRGKEESQSRLRVASDGHIDERPGLPLWKEGRANGEDRLHFLDEL